MGMALQLWSMRLRWLPLFVWVAMVQSVMGRFFTLCMGWAECTNRCAVSLWIPCSLAVSPHLMMDVAITAALLLPPATRGPPPQAATFVWVWSQKA